MKNIIYNKQVVDVGGKLRVTGEIVLKRDVIMRNLNNNGLTPDDAKYKHPATINVVKGVRVRYFRTESKSAHYHYVQTERNGMTFEYSISTNKPR
jgi:hypothetical protein